MSNFSVVGRYLQAYLPRVASSDIMLWSRCFESLLWIHDTEEVLTVNTCLKSACFVGGRHFSWILIESASSRLLFGRKLIGWSLLQLSLFQLLLLLSMLLQRSLRNALQGWLVAWLFMPNFKLERASWSNCSCPCNDDNETSVGNLLIQYCSLRSWNEESEYKTTIWNSVETYGNRGRHERSKIKSKKGGNKVTINRDTDSKSHRIHYGSGHVNEYLSSCCGRYSDQREGKQVHS